MNIKQLLPFYGNYVNAMSRISALETALDYVLREPRYIDEEAWSFNGQHHRRAIFGELVAAIPFAAILETGTFFGNTTGHMRQRVQCPILTCEARPIFQSVAKSRLKEFSGIEYTLGDSRSFLRDVLSRPPLKDAKEPLFFYLDAHWHEDLPLEQEIDIIGKWGRNCVVMIDDFAVPGDRDYSYDDYGPGKALNLATFGPAFARAGLSVYWPSLMGREESGGKRGCVILGCGEDVCGVLAAMQTIRSGK